MPDKNLILLTIAARAGSKGIKNKNIRKLCGIPLIGHTIKQAIKWGKADKIICTTDSKKIAFIAKKYGACVPFLRPAELAGDCTGKLDVLRHALTEVEKIYNKKYQIIVDLDVTAPIRKISDIDNAYNLFIRKHPNSVFSVTNSHKNPYFNMVEIRNNGFAKLVKKPRCSIKRRQDAPSTYDMNASIYVYNRKFLLNKDTISPVTNYSVPIIMEDISSFDIDTEKDFQFIEFLVSKGIVRL